MPYSKLTRLPWQRVGSSRVRRFPHHRQRTNHGGAAHPQSPFRASLASYMPPTDRSGDGAEFPSTGTFFGAPIKGPISWNAVSPVCLRRSPHLRTNTIRGACRSAQPVMGVERGQAGLQEEPGIASGPTVLAGGLFVSERVSVSGLSAGVAPAPRPIPARPGGDGRRGAAQERP